MQINLFDRSFTKYSCTNQCFLIMAYDLIFDYNCVYCCFGMFQEIKNLFQQ